MPLDVWTSRVSTRDVDRFDVTRKSGDLVFAPSWSILGPVLARRRANVPETSEMWRDYAQAYLREMTSSYRENRVRWEAVLARPRVVLTCYCTDPNRCHRTLLAKVFEKLGAIYRGEL
jgi:uncharacterized protein YeaO (DUF488 family)